MKSRLHHSPKNDRTKCVRLLNSKGDGLIVRVSNDEAHKLVIGNHGNYVPKKDWKAQEAAQKKKAA